MFTADAVPGLADGSISVTFRRWKRPQAKVGGRFHKDDLWFEVDGVRTVPVDRISKADARRAGEVDADAVRRRLGDPAPDTEVYRIAFHRIDPAGPPVDDADLGPEEIAEITRRLDRMDGAAAAGPWTRATLALIATHPGVVSTSLAETLERALRPEERHPQAEAPRPHPEPGGWLRAVPPGPGLSSIPPRRCRDRSAATSISYQGPTALSRAHHAGGEWWHADHPNRHQSRDRLMRQVDARTGIQVMGTVTSASPCSPASMSVDWRSSTGIRR